MALGDATAVLNFANPDTAGGYYRVGARAQEEDLCRLLPQLYPSLIKSQTTHNFYPIVPGTALVTQGLSIVRKPGTYALCSSLGTVSIVTAAMPRGTADRRPSGGWKGSEWWHDVSFRIRAVLYSCLQSGHTNLVLGAFGCGAFGNPAGPVAAVFREQLSSDEFRGAFSRVVFAVIDPVGTGNLKPFRQEMDKWKTKKGTTTSANNQRSQPPKKSKKSGK